jgi:hypothetical protein
VALVILCAATPVRAQSEAAVALGLSISSYDPPSSLGLSSTSMGPLIRINLGPGFGPIIGFDWHSTRMEAMAGNQRVYLGELRVRPVLVGAGYTVKRGRYWYGAGITAGYAFNRLTVNDRARPAFRSSLGSQFVSFDARNSFVWRSRFGVFYDASPSVGLTAAVAYMRVSPTLRMTTDTGVRQSKLDASCVIITFGLAYGVF